MVLICNVKVQQDAESRHSDEWTDLYRKNERFIESGSAYFSQAFAEALAVVSDIELHNPEQAQLRFGSISALLAHATEQYRTSLEIDDRSGLLEHHETMLQDCGLDLNGTEKALGDGRTSGFIAADDQFINRFAVVFHEHGYRGLMDSYIDRLSVIEALARTTDPSVDFQGLTWQLTAAFAEAMMFGQCIAVMNAVAYR